MSQPAPFEAVFVSEFALQHPVEAKWIYEKVCAKAPKKVLEVGVCGAGTLRMWCAAAERGALVVGLDVFDDAHRDSAIRRCAQIAEARGIDLRIVQADSSGQDALAAWDLGPWDFVHVDGHHADPYVTSDFRRAVERLAPGGFVAFHDAFDQGCADVVRVVATAESEGFVVEKFWAGDGDYPPMGIKRGDRRLGYGVVSKRL